MTTQIVIVGTAGAGKTILATVWAKNLSDLLGDVFLTANDAGTMYTAKTWDTLCNKGEWLPSTGNEPGFELQWILHLKQQTVPVKLINFAGRNLRQLFSADRFKDPDLPNNEREILQYVQSSNIIVLVVNMADYIGEEEYAKQTENENMLVSVIQSLAESGRMLDILIVFTAYDQHRSAIKAKSGSFEKYLKQELTSLYNACKASENRIHLQTIAAVAETETKTDEDSGKTFCTPKRGFRSYGLNTFTDWICKSVARQTQTNQRLSGIQMVSPQEDSTIVGQVNENDKKSEWQLPVNAYPAAPQDAEQEKQSRVSHLLSVMSAASAQEKRTIGKQSHKNRENLGGCLGGCIGGGIGGGIGMSINGGIGLVLGMWIGSIIGGVLGLWEEENIKKGNWAGKRVGMVIGLFIGGGIVGIIGVLLWRSIFGLFGN